MTETASGGLLLCAVIGLALTPAHSAAEEFDRERLESLAAELAAAPHQPPSKVGPDFLDLDYDSYRLIAQRHERALWRDADSPTWVEFFPAGFLYQHPVRVHTVEVGQARELPYSGEWFQFRGDAQPLRDASGGGFAGLRLLTRLPGNEHPTEYLAFLGASYFRGIGAGDWYGASARGLAIDIGLPRPEEFPRFTDFWIERPSRGSDTQVVWALLESPGVVGAYEFRAHPGEQLRVDVHAKVWRRHGIQKLALAPITSMWMWDAASQPEGEHRPEVHDSDGLLIHRDTDEWVWRRLMNPSDPRVESWPAETLHGFGLLQRDRDPDHYNDPEARYHLRPSVWVNTDGGPAWQGGRVELLELPCPHEGVDSIGAYWVLDQDALPQDAPISFDYQLTFGDQPPLGRKPVAVLADQVDGGSGEAVVRFEQPGALAGVSVDRLAPRVEAPDGEVTNLRIRQSGPDQVEATFSYRPHSKAASRVQLRLEQAGEPVSEIWSYRWE